MESRKEEPCEHEGRRKKKGEVHAGGLVGVEKRIVKERSRGTGGGNKKGCCGM